MHSGIESLSTYCRHSQLQPYSNVFAERGKRKPSEQRRPRELRRRNFTTGEYHAVEPTTAVQTDSTTKAILLHTPAFYVMSRHFESKDRNPGPHSVMDLNYHQLRVSGQCTIAHYGPLCNSIPEQSQILSYNHLTTTINRTENTRRSSRAPQWQQVRSSSAPTYSRHHKFIASPWETSSLEAGPATQLQPPAHVATIPGTSIKLELKNQSATNNSQHSRVTASRHPDNTDLRTTVTLCHLGELDGGGPQQPRTCQEFFHKCSNCNCHGRDHTETPASCERGSYPSGNDIRGRVPLGVTVKRAVRPAQVASARVARRFLG